LQTTFSLIYFECAKSILTLSNAIIGPKLFTSRAAAIDKLFLYIEGRLTDGFEDLLEQYIESNEALINSVDLDVMEHIRANSSEQLALIEYYFKYMQDDLCHAGFSIDELPTSSFVEQLERANAIEIDGQFIRYFSLTSLEHLADQDIAAQFNEQLLLESEVWDDDMNKHVFEFTYGQAMDAYYDTNNMMWRVNGHSVTLITFS
jgi:hypothetical protein